MRTVLLPLLSSILLLACASPKAADDVPGGRQALVDNFLRRLQDVADAGSLFDAGKTMRALDLGYTVDTAESVQAPADCSVDWHDRSATRTNVALTEGRWYAPSRFGVEQLHVPAFAINRETTITGKPELRYTVTHTVRCADSQEVQGLQDETKAELMFYPLPPFVCISSEDIRKGLPRSHFIMATDGVSEMQYDGRLDDDSGTTLSFRFRAGADCALSADIEQSQRSGLRYLRALAKFRSCSAAVDKKFCAERAPGGWDGAAFDEMERNRSRSCGTVNALYLKEPRSGEVPPPETPPKALGTPCG